MAVGTSWNHWATIPATFVIAFFLFGIEEIGIQVHREGGWEREREGRGSADRANCKP